MKYLLILSMITVTGLAIYTVPSLGRRSDENQGTRIGVESDPTLPRDQALLIAKIQAEAYGEANPVLVDATIAPLQEQPRKLDPENPLEGPSTNALAWMVRMRGSFLPARMPPLMPGETLEPVQGVMFVIIDAASGQKLGSGFGPD